MFTRFPPRCSEKGRIHDALCIIRWYPYVVGADVLSIVSHQTIIAGRCMNERKWGNLLVSITLLLTSQDNGLYFYPSPCCSSCVNFCRKLLQAPVEALCKTMIVENTMVDKQSISDPENPLKNRCFAVLLQYCTKLDTERLAKQLRNMALERYPAEEAPSFKLKMAEAEDSYKLTGYEFNAITPFGTTNELPLILSRNIVRQQSEGTFRYVWLGGGDPDLKLRLFVKQVQTKYKPAVFVVECTEARNEYMDEQE